MDRCAGASRTAAPATALHPGRLLVAVAEQHAIAAERAAGDTASPSASGADPADVDLAAHQATYDKATVRAALERLTLAYWRAQRQAASVEALRADLTRADTEDQDEDRPGTPRGNPAGRSDR